MKIATESYLNQKARWPCRGRVILANYDAESIVVYQAYRPSIGHFAAENGYFGGEFNLDRMTWIKPNFLWMMYRSGWGTKPGQEVILAVRLWRSAFDEILNTAVHSKYIPELYLSEQDWKRSIKISDVRLQWDPDHSPTGGKLLRRAIQLGLQSSAIVKYSRDWIVDIEDISEFVAAQKEYALGGNIDRLFTPIEYPYPIPNSDIATRLQIDLI